MPPKKGERKLNAQRKNLDEDFFDTEENEEIDASGDYNNSFHPPTSNTRTPRPRDDEKQLLPTSNRKRNAEEDYDPADFSSEMQTMLATFGADISKTLNHKKKRMEQFTQNSLKNTNKKIEDLWNAQHNARAKLQEEFGRQINAVYQQWETDIEKSKEQEEKLNTLFKQQQKQVQQSRIVQSQRLKTVRELCDQFSRSLDELDQQRESQQSSLQTDLKKEMSLLQKKILMDTQQQEMANVKKNLHQMLF